MLRPTNSFLVMTCVLCHLVALDVPAETLNLTDASIADINAAFDSGA